MIRNYHNSNSGRVRISLLLILGILFLFTQSVWANYKPIADFIRSSESICEGLTVSYLDQSVRAETWFWDFGDGTTSTEQNPTHTFDKRGSYTVTLTVTNEFGSDSKNVVEFVGLGTLPTADFSSDLNSGCGNTTVNFMDLSTFASSWFWEFGDGATSNEQNPTHEYTSSGDFNVFLTVSNDCGEDVHVKIEYIHIMVVPRADFIASKTETCIGNSITFINWSSNADSYFWEFGDGTTSTEENPTHLYTNDGYFNVRLTAYNECGSNLANKDFYIYIYQPPVALFTYNIIEGCNGGTVEFTDITHQAQSWYWTFGDGTTSTEQNPIHVYDTAGTYVVTLTVTNMCGSSTKDRIVTLKKKPVPVADFTTELTEYCAEHLITFTNLAQNADKYLWDFGDGTNSTDENPTHQYANAGVYTISLTASNDCGDDTETKVEYITIFPLPYADFSASSTDICTNSLVYFTDLSLNADNWYWDFGDGETSIGQNPGHTYTSPGNYTVSLTVSNQCGDDTATKELYIRVIDPPTADFDYETSGLCEGGTATFMNLSSGAVSFYWEFGDGLTSTIENPTHTYASTGTFTVILTVTNMCGKDDISREIEVSVMKPPIADFVADPTEACVNTNVQFTDLSVEATGYSWDFGDGMTSIDPNPTHIYSVAGQYTVSMTVTNLCGTDTETKTLYITVLPKPIANYDYQQDTECEVANFSFIDQSDYTESWYWDFGNGMTSTAQHPQTTYTANGNYTVILIATNTCGSDTTSKIIRVELNKPPVANFIVSPPYGCIGKAITFIDRSDGATSWLWTFGDGDSSTVINPQHTYSASGSYTISLTVTNNCGQDTETKVNYLYIGPLPAGSFTANPLSGCAPLTVIFDNNSDDAPYASWKFGDGATSGDWEPTHTYTTPGTYTVEFYAGNDCGSDGPYFETITVYGNPVAEFTANQTYICPGDTVKFTDQSTDATSWEWFFGDGGSSAVQNPTHVYTQTGGYSVFLRVNGECGQDEIEKIYYINVAPLPTAKFSGGGTYCTDIPITFTNNSTEANSYTWHFGDGTTSTAVNPSHTYSTAGTYSVSLIAINGCGIDTALHEDIVHIMPDPTAAYTYKITPGCDSTLVEFTDHSLDYIFAGWIFGDGSSTTDISPSHYYHSSGTFTVSRSVSNVCGTDDETKEIAVTVGVGPTAGFTANNTEVCTGDTVRFTNQSIGATSYIWYFGDGDSATAVNTTHTYLIEGVYSILLKAINDCGDDEELKSEYITVSSQPVAEFTADPNKTCVGSEIQFTNNSLYADSYIWNFGDGQTSTAASPIHTYNIGGLYTITLMAKNGCGVDTTIKSEYVTVDDGPEADFTGTPLSGRAPLTVNFTDHSLSDLGITSWSWNFGDGQTSAIQNPIHIYNIPGIYNVKLVVADDCGTDSLIRSEYVYVGDSCQIDFNKEQEGTCAGATAYFNGYIIGSCEIDSWSWNFGDPTSGANNSATGQSSSHTYNTGGSFNVTLTAIAGNDTITVTKSNFVTIKSKPTASFSTNPTTGDVPLMAFFTDQTIGLDSTSNWSWDFGDPSSGGNNISTRQDPVHLYNNIGIYTVRMIVTNECGADTATSIIDLTPDTDLLITKTVDKANAIANDTLEYTIAVTNSSGEYLYNILVSDTVPNYSAYVINSASNSGTYNISSNVVHWTLGTLGPRSAVNLTFKVVLNGPFTQYPVFIQNYAVAVIPDQPVAKVTESRTFISNIVETIVNQPTALIEISKAVSATVASPGDNLTYTITVINRSPAPINNVIIHDAIPDLTSFVANSDNPSGAYVASNDSLIWNVGTLNPLASYTAEFVVSIAGSVSDGDQIPNTALATSSSGAIESNRVVTTIGLQPMSIRKTASAPSGMIGDIIRFTVSIHNYSSVDLTDVIVLDTMPSGMFYIDGSSTLDGAVISDPTGSNPYNWSLTEDIPAGDSLVVNYSMLIGASAHPGFNDNIARAEAIQSGSTIYSNRSVARIYLLGDVLSGSIRGKLIVDCDGDGVADIDQAPSGVDIYLDDGSQSRVNNHGIFYFSTVRAGERVVALDERDLDGFYVPDEAQASVFVHVHETGESYVIFRICPDYPRLDILKKASIIPTVKVTKSAKINPEEISDSLGVQIDYRIDVKSNGLTDPTQVRIVDSMPEFTRLILNDEQPLNPKNKDGMLVYEITAAQERIEKSVFYSLKDLQPGMRRFISNKIHLEGDLAQEGEENKQLSSEPTEVAVGPFLLAPPFDVNVTLTPALFITSKADLLEPAFPQLEAVADSIDKYADAAVKVEGHCDYRRIHTKEFPSNWELGEARAKAVVDWLIENRDIERSRLDYESFAATKPKVLGGVTSEQLQPNRRTEVIIRAKVEGFIDPSVIPADNWHSTTSLALEPISFDTLYEFSDPAIETGLDDSWEILLSVKNHGAIPAENSTLSDILPDGVVYIENSASVNGLPVSASVEGNILGIALDNIEPKESIIVRYRVRALENVIPSGGGAASIELKTANDMSVIQKSNEIRFK
ncbi:MAG: PKD domain-containing protein [Candidatus Zixiibacteriota bacterium]